MKRIITLLLAAASFAACSSSDRNLCTINGTIYGSDNRNGEWIYLVPEGPHKDVDVDSVLVDNGKFTFTVNKEMIAIIRVAMSRGIGLQELLVVTEPGTVNASISSSSKVEGTFQNDSLQLWKELTDQAMKDRMKASGKAAKDSVREAYKERTRQLAHNCGDETTIGKFLLSRYPEKIR